MSEDVKLEEIMKSWQEDGKLAPIGYMAQQKHELFVKYHRIYFRENAKLQKMHVELKNLKHELRHFYLYGDEKENEKGWKLPSRGKILKQEIGEFVSIHPDITDKEIMISLQESKVAYVKEILREISTRNFLMNIHLEETKLKEGII